MTDQPYCAICDRDFVRGDVVRTWQTLRGDATCHEACYVDLSTNAARRATRWPLITAAEPHAWIDPNREGK
jgi:hypothetical protein